MPITSMKNMRLLKKLSSLRRRTVDKILGVGEDQEDSESVPVTKGSRRTHHTAARATCSAVLFEHATEHAPLLFKC
jgi:hypothetical protein